MPKVPDTTEILDLFARYFPQTSSRVTVEPMRNGNLRILVDVRGLGHGPVSAERELMAVLVPAGDRWIVRPTKTKYARVDGVLWQINTNKPDSSHFWVLGQEQMPLSWAIAAAMFKVTNLRSLGPNDGELGRASHLDEFVGAMA